jgi:hypothetical protein
MSSANDISLKKRKLEYSPPPAPAVEHKINPFYYDPRAIQHYTANIVYEKGTPEDKIWRASLFYRIATVIKRDLDDPNYNRDGSDDKEVKIEDLDCVVRNLLDEMVFDPQTDQQRLSAAELNIRLLPLMLDASCHEIDNYYVIGLMWSYVLQLKCRESAEYDKLQNQLKSSISL